MNQNPVNPSEPSRFLEIKRQLGSHLMHGHVPVFNKPSKTKIFHFSVSRTSWRTLMDFLPDLLTLGKIHMAHLWLKLILYQLKACIHGLQIAKLKID
jgi:hypothetical protein